MPLFPHPLHSPHSHSMRRWRYAALGCSWLVALAAVIGTRAEEKQSIVSLSVPTIWNAPTTWSPAGEPGAADDVSIGDTVDDPVTFQLQNAPIIYTTLQPDSTILGNLKINAALVSDPGSFLLVGLAPSLVPELSPYFSRGIHQEGLTLRTTSEIYGDDKSGYFLQTGGLHTVENDVTLGRLDTAFGLYLIDAPVDGVFRVRRDLVVGDAGRGLLQQVLGETIVQRDLWFGKSTGGHGSGLIAGRFQVWNDLIVGGYGEGLLAFTAVAPTPTVGSRIVLGLGAGSSGTLSLAPAARIAATGSIIVGDAGTGLLGTGPIDPLAPTATTQADLIAGHQVGSTGTISGVSLEVGSDLVIGDAGTGTGTVALGNTATVGHDLEVGRESTGVGALEVGRQTVGMTSPELYSGSSLSVTGNALIGNQGQGTLSMYSGTMSIGGRLGIGAGSGGSGSVTLGAATTIADAAQLNISGNLEVGAMGQGQLTILGPSQVTVGGQLLLGVGGTGDVSVAGGSITLGNQATIGGNGSGSWQQSAGSATFSGSVGLGTAAAGTGSLSLSGGTLSALSLNLLTTGTLSLTGGTMNLGSLALLGGTLTNNGGQLTVGDLFLGGGTITGNIRTTGATSVDSSVSGFNGALDNGGTFTLDQSFSPSLGFSNSGSTIIIDGGVLATPGLQIDSGDLTVESGGVIDVDALHNAGGDFTMKPDSWLFTDLLNLGGGSTDIQGGHLVIADVLNVENSSVSIASGTVFDAKSITVGSGGWLDLGPGVWVPPADSRLAIAAGGGVSFNASGPTAALNLPDEVVVSGDGVQTTSLQGDGAWHLTANSTMLLSRAALTGGGTLTVDAGAHLDIIGNGTTLNRNISNHGQTRLNAVVTPGFMLGGSATLTNESDGTLRILDEPLLETDSNYNRLRATGLDVVNAGTMTIGALTPQSGSAALPWFWLDQSFTNTGSLSLLQSTTFTVEGAFTSSGAITLANASQLTALGGGTLQGTLALGPEANSFAVFRGATIYDNGATFTGSGGFVSMEGGTLHTATGEYVPTVNLELLGNLAMPEATGLAVGDGRWLRIAGSVPALPVRVGSGGTLELMGGTNTNAITVEHGGAMRLGDSYSNPTNHTRPDEPNILNAVAGQSGRGDIENHGTLTVVPGSVTGTGRVLNRADGVALAISDFGTAAQEMLLEVVNEGLLTLWTRDESIPFAEYHGGVRFGNITNSGTATLKATETTADPYNDVSLRIGTYTQTAGTTTLETTGAGSQYLPFVQADSFSILGGTVNASGRLVTPTVENAGIFQVGSAGLSLTGAFNNNSGGDLRLTGNLSTTGAFAFNSGSRLLLNGATAGVTQNGSALFAGDFNTPAGTTIELRDRSTSGGNPMTVQGTLIIGSGATLERNGGYLDGSGEVRVASGGSLVLGGSFDGSGGGPITIAAGGSMDLASRSYSFHRFNSRTVTNDGTVMHTAAGLAMNASTTITNNGTWTVALAGTGDVGGFNTEGGQPLGGAFINNGTFNQNGLNMLYFGSYGAGPSFTNRGTLNVNSGEMQIRSSSTFSGTSVVNLASGTSLLLRDGVNTIESGARFTGAGSLILGFGSQTTLTGDIYADQATLSEGTGYGTHTLHGSWRYQDYFNLGTPGTTTIASDSTFTFAAGSQRLNDRTFINYGTVNHILGSLYMNASTTVENRGSWTVDLPGTGTVGGYRTEGGQPVGGSFVNYGTFTKGGLNNLDWGSNNSGPDFTNHATVNVLSGILSIRGQGTFSGSSVVNLSSGATLELRDGTANIQSGARFQGAGTLSLGDAGTHNLNGDIYADNASLGGGTLNGTHTLHGNWKLLYYPNIATAGTTTIASDGTWQFGAATNNISNRSFVNHGEITHTDGALVLNADSTVSNHGTWTESSGATISSSGDLQGLVGNTGAFIKTGASTTTFDFYNSPRFSNTGTVDVQQGTLQLNRSLVQHSGSTLTGGTWIVRNGASLREDNTTNYTSNQANVTLHGSGDYTPLNSISTNAGTLRLLDGKVWSTAATFTNSGTLVIGAGSSFSTTSTFANSGVLDLSGAFSSAGLTNTGTILGSGTFTGSLINAATLSPGHSPGLLTVTGDLTLQGTSTLLMELGGLVEGVTYDNIDVGGTLIFGGTLNVSLVNAFTPVSGATFNLFEAGTFSGTFSNVMLPVLTGGLSWDTAGLYSTGRLGVTGTAVPEPSTYAAFAGFAALGIALWRRRLLRR